MASDFIYVVVAGVAILVIGGVLAGFAEDAGFGDGEEAEEAILSEKLGTIGQIHSTSRTVDFDDITVEAETSESEVARRDIVEIGSSVFGVSRETLSFESPQSGRMHITFTLSESSDPDNLIIKVNGEKVDVPEYTVGEQVSLQSSTLESGENTVTFLADRPGKAFWKRPSYVLEDVSVSAFHPREVRPFRVFDYEVEGFDRGELRFSITEDIIRDEPLDMKINADKIFEGTPIKRALPYVRTFHANTTGITAGENVLSLSTSGESSYVLENLQLTFYHMAGDQRRTVLREFNLSSSEYKRLEGEKARISLEVDRTTLQSPVTIDLPGKEFTQALDAGTNTFSFGQDAVEEGENTLKISTDGSYRVSNMNISFVPEE
ncbi:MAG: hypothetical protein MUP63_00725 [Candidatus Nanohaloarchaeota archaeon QJJ-7]|nr:hypothetical protein [Candidatus Nanohaloarchaeota archaeon QJJ-7]